jgi:quaternary ammonium compound-resistance protein SugE
VVRHPASRSNCSTTPEPADGDRLGGRAHGDPEPSAGWEPWQAKDRALALKYTDGFTRFWPSVISITAAVVGFIMLSMALKSLPVGTAYAMWVGIGAVGVALAGIFALGESASLVRLSLLAMIVVGIIGRKVIET